MGRSVIGLLLMVLFIFLLMGCDQDDLLAQEYSGFRENIYKQFSEEMPFFIPNISGDTAYEFVYESEDQDGFSFDLYLDEEQRILTDKEHRDLGHTHGSNDLFYSFFKVKGDLEGVSIKEFVAEIYGGDTSLEDMPRKIINRYTSCYEEGIVEYNKGNYEVYWITDRSRQNRVDNYIQNIEEMLIFLKTEGVSHAFVILSEVGEVNNVSLYIPGEEHYMELSFYVTKDQSFKDMNQIEPLLKGIGQKLKNIK